VLYECYDTLDSDLSRVKVLYECCECEAEEVMVIMMVMVMVMVMVTMMVMVMESYLDCRQRA
jgi:hypothetical protein